MGACCCRQQQRSQKLERTDSHGCRWWTCCRGCMFPMDIVSLPLQTPYIETPRHGIITFQNLASQAASETYGLRLWMFCIWYGTCGCCRSLEAMHQPSRGITTWTNLGDSWSSRCTFRPLCCGSVSSSFARAGRLPCCDMTVILSSFPL